MIEGALILLGGILVGRLLPNRKKKPSDPKPICGCSHHNSLHDPQTGVCHGQIQRNKYNSIGGWIGQEYIPCTCRQYVGPKPIDQFFNTPMLPPRDS